MNNQINITMLSDKAKEFLDIFYKILNNKSIEEKLLIIEKVKKLLLMN